MAHLVSLDVEVVLLGVLGLELGLPATLEVGRVGEDGLGAFVESVGGDQVSERGHNSRLGRLVSKEGRLVKLMS